MVTYVNALAKLHAAYDGYLIHSRGCDGCALRAAITGPPELPAIATPANTMTRTDLTVPAFVFQSESDRVREGVGRQVRRRQVANRRGGPRASPVA